MACGRVDRLMDNPVDGKADHGLTTAMTPLPTTNKPTR
jgi:hypothetical protein